jgi:hypothetical protein
MCGDTASSTCAGIQRAAHVRGYSEQQALAGAVTCHAAPGATMSTSMTACRYGHTCGSPTFRHNQQQRAACAPAPASRHLPHCMCTSASQQAPTTLHVHQRQPAGT